LDGDLLLLLLLLLLICVSRALETSKKTTAMVPPPIQGSLRRLTVRPLDVALIFAAAAAAAAHLRLESPRDLQKKNGDGGPLSQGH
jgi:hypothetical protein